MPSLYLLLQTAQQKPKRQHSKPVSTCVTLSHQSLFQLTPTYCVTSSSDKPPSLNRPALSRLTPLQILFSLPGCLFPSSQPGRHLISPLQSNSNVTSFKALLNSTREDSFASFSSTSLNFAQTSVIDPVKLGCNSLITDQTIS